jgi:2-polyprenyl-6-methoxyphenol hydroxylase-like FAD-dependent oxidoreductase
MAFEDAETLAYTLAETLVPLKQEQDEQSRLASLTSKWNAHRHARVARVIDFTARGGTLRKSSSHIYAQVAKEWLIWAVFKWRGSEGGAQWMYEYSAENIRADLA